MVVLGVAQLAISGALFSCSSTLPLSDLPIWTLTSEGAWPAAVHLSTTHRGGVAGILNTSHDANGSGTLGASSGLRVENVSLPSLVQLDLARAGAIPNPLLGNQLDDGSLRWIHDSSRNWTYTTMFAAPAAAQRQLVLVAQSLDTLATVRLNGVVVGFSTNMHVRMALELPPTLLRYGAENTLAISFDDPISYSIAEYAKHPCSCDGCCHFNATQYPIYNWAQGRPWIRKVQSHYGWNWGPASMPYGVPREIFIVELDTRPLLEDMRVSVKPTASMLLPTERLNDNSTDFDVALELRIRAVKFVAAGTVLTVIVDWNDGIPHTIRLPELTAGTNTVIVKLTAVRPTLWWPRELLMASGRTRPAMYNITVALGEYGSGYLAPQRSLGLHDEFSYTLRRRVGFRTAELVRDPARDGNGTIFAWRINGVLLYVRGANIIPYDVFMTEKSVGHAYGISLRSAAAAHMSMVRVWGGGAYLGDAFYDEADELGLLVWQEIMFACAIYPTWPEFKDSVRAEIIHQTRRLSSHPSLVLWCGNNEAEQSQMSPTAWRQYYNLAYEVIISTLRNVTADAEVELWPSSPSNGFQSTWSDPRDATRGDVHRYVYFGDCTDSSLYGEMPRFQSEFGFPSYPSDSELAPFVTNETEDMRTLSRFHIARQDLNCPLSNATLEVHGLGTGKRAGCEFPMMSLLLPTPSGSAGWETQTSDVWRHSLYMGQVAQGLCVKAQAEHLRRGRDTAAQTAGSLFWQLNSEWPGASKSSLQYDGSWKVLHHLAAQFYEPFHLSGFLTDGYKLIHLHLANDAWQGDFEVTWSVDIWHWAAKTPIKRAWCPQSSGCQLPVSSSSGSTLFAMPVQQLLELIPGDLCVNKANCVAVASASARNAAGSTLRSNAFVPLGSGTLRDAPLSAAAVVNATVHSNLSVTVVSDALIPYAFLRLKPAPAVAADVTQKTIGGSGLGRFSDNAFLLVPQEPVTVQLLGLRDDLPTITPEELRLRLTVDCPNRVGGCCQACE